MFKKSFIFVLPFIVTACSSNNQPEEAFPGQFADADYVLSDQDAQKMGGRKANRLVNVFIQNLTRIQQIIFKEDSYIHAQYVFFYPLEKVIGRRICQNSTIR